MKFFRKSLFADREPPGTRSIVAYSWARRLALDYRPSRECNDDSGSTDSPIVVDGTPVESRTSFVASSRASNVAAFTTHKRRNVTVKTKKWLETIPRRLFLYSAHLDIRVTGYPSVRVIGVKREPAPSLLSSGTLFCTIW